MAVKYTVKHMVDYGGLGKSEHHVAVQDPRIAVIATNRLKEKYISALLSRKCFNAVLSTSFQHFNSFL